MPLSVNFPLASGPRTTGMTKFEFKHMEELSLILTSLIIWSEDHGMIEFPFKHL